MSSDSADLRKSYAELAHAYSQDVRESTLVVFTKSNKAGLTLDKRFA